MLRIERGLSKQQLAKAAGISRQQLWRVLAGKSDLTSSLRERLAFVLRTDAAVLQQDLTDEADTDGISPWRRVARQGGALAPATATSTTTLTLPAPSTFTEFIATTEHVQGLLAALPTCDSGLALKRAVLDSIEDVAMARGIALPVEFFDLRRAVITRTL